MIVAPVGRVRGAVRRATSTTETGRWQLTAKTQDASIEAWHAVARGDREARDRVLYALDETGLRFEDDRAPLTTLAREDPAGLRPAYWPRT